MAEKDQEHLRIRLGPRLLKRIDVAREKSGRTRSDEIEARLEESFRRWDLHEAAELGRNWANGQISSAMERIEQIDKQGQEQKKRIEWLEKMLLEEKEKGK